MHVAIWSGRKTKADGVSDLVNANTCAIRVRNGASSVCNNKGANSKNGVNRTGLFPFRMASAQYSIALTDDKKVRLTRIMQNRHLGTDWQSMDLRRRAKELIRVRSERDVVDLGLVYRLLRAVPDLSRERLPVGLMATKERLTPPRLRKTKAVLISGGSMVITIDSDRDGI